MTFAQTLYDHQRIYLFPSEAIADEKTCQDKRNNELGNRILVLHHRAIIYAQSWINPALEFLQIKAH
jgi:hypothetical protein